MFVYIINHFVAFPTSEYGGRVTILAKDDAEAIAFLTEKAKGGDLGYGADREESLEAIPHAVENAIAKLALDSEASEPVLLDKFTT